MNRILTTYRQPLLLAVIVIFHTVGIVGMYSEQRTYFLSLSPLNLLLSVICLILSFRISTGLLLDLLVVATVGFAAEWIGVHTGYLFGNYAYGSNLGWKWLDIPLIIGVNWVMLSGAAVACVAHVRVPQVVRALLSALLMTALDVLIEPVAVKSDYWHWEGGIIPLYNYISWFMIAFPLHLFLIRRKRVEQNAVSVGLFLVLIVFFSILNSF